MTETDLFAAESMDQLEWFAPEGPTGNRTQHSVCGRYHITEIPDSHSSARRLEAWFGKPGDGDAKLIGEIFATSAGARLACERHHEGGY